MHSEDHSTELMDNKTETESSEAATPLDARRHRQILKTALPIVAMFVPIVLLAVLVYVAGQSDLEPIPKPLLAAA